MRSNEVRPAGEMSREDIAVRRAMIQQIAQRMQRDRRDAARARVAALFEEQRRVEEEDHQVEGVDELVFDAEGVFDV